MNNEKPTLEQLKSAAYDHLVEIQRLNHNLEQINKEIGAYSKPIETPEENAEKKAEESLDEARELATEE